MEFWGFETRSELPGQSFGLFEEAGAAQAAQTQKVPLMWNDNGDGNFQAVPGAQIEVNPDGVASEDEITKARKAYEDQTGKKAGSNLTLSWTENNKGKEETLYAQPVKNDAGTKPDGENKRAEKKGEEPQGKNIQNKDAGGPAYAVVDAPGGDCPVPDREYYVREAGRMGLFDSPSFSMQPVSRRDDGDSGYMRPVGGQRPFIPDYRPAMTQEPQWEPSQPQQTAWLDFNGDGVGDREVPILDVQLKKADGKIDDEERDLLAGAFLKAMMDGSFGGMPKNSRPDDYYFAVRNADGELLGLNGRHAFGPNKKAKKEKAGDEKDDKKTAKAPSGEDAPKKEVPADEKLKGGVVAARQMAAVKSPV